MTTNAKLAFNLQTGSYLADINVLPGVNLDLKGLLSGSNPLPQIDLKEVLSNLPGLRSSVQSDYSNVRTAAFNHSAGGSVFFASKQFTDWASAETLLNLAGKAFLTGGKGALSEIAAHVLPELNDIYVWLKNNAAADAPRLAVQILQAILSGQDFTTPSLTFKIVSVDYTTTFGVSGILGTALEALHQEKEVAVASTHKAFVLSWTGGGGIDLKNVIDNVAANSLKGGFEPFLESMLQVNVDSKLRTLLEFAVSGGSGLDQIVKEKISNLLSISSKDLSNIYQPGSPIIDMKGTELAERLRSAMLNLAFGNDRSVEVATLEFNLSTMSFSIEVAIRNKWDYSLSDVSRAISMLS